MAEGGDFGLESGKRTVWTVDIGWRKADADGVVMVTTGYAKMI